MCLLRLVYSIISNVILGLYLFVVGRSYRSTLICAEIAVKRVAIRIGYLWSFTGGLWLIICVLLILLTFQKVRDLISLIELLQLVLIQSLLVVPIVNLTMFKWVLLAMLAKLWNDFAYFLQRSLWRFSLIIRIDEIATVGVNHIPGVTQIIGNIRCLIRVKWSWVNLWTSRIDLLNETNWS